MSCLAVVVESIRWLINEKELKVNQSLDFVKHYQEKLRRAIPVGLKCETQNSCCDFN